MKISEIVAEYERRVAVEPGPLSSARMGGIGAALVRSLAAEIKTSDDGLKLVAEHPDIFNAALGSNATGTLLDALRSTWKAKVTDALATAKGRLFLDQFPADVDVRAHVADLVNRVADRFEAIYVTDEDHIGELAIRSVFDALAAAKRETSSVTALKKAVRVSPILQKEFWDDVTIASDLCDYKAVNLMPKLVDYPLRLDEDLAKYYDADTMDAARVAADVRKWEAITENPAEHPDEDFDRLGTLLIAGYGHLIRLEGGRNGGGRSRDDVPTGDFYAR